MTTRSLEHYARVQRSLRPSEAFIDGLVRLAIQDAVIAAEGNQARAAETIGVHVSTVHRKVLTGELDLTREDGSLCPIAPRGHQRPKPASCRRPWVVPFPAAASGARS